MPTAHHVAILQLQQWMTLLSIIFKEKLFPLRDIE